MAWTTVSSAFHCEWLPTLCPHPTIFVDGANWQQTRPAHCAAAKPHSAISWMDVALPSDKAVTRGDMTTSSAFWSGIFSNSGNVCSVSRPTPPRMLRSSTLSLKAFPNCRFDCANDDRYFPPTLCAVPAIGNFCLMLMADITFFRLRLRRPAQRPDIVIYSLSLRKVLLVELTVPLEDRVAAAHTIKTTRYASLLSACESNGFGVFHFPVEVGSRGFVARSLLDCLRQLGFPPALRRKVRNECSRVALRSSFIIYLRRAIDLWRDMSSLTWKGLQNFSAVSLAQFLRWSLAFLQLVSPCSLYKNEVLLHSDHMGPLQRNDCFVIVFLPLSWLVSCMPVFFFLLLSLSKSNRWPYRP